MKNEENCVIKNFTLNIKIDNYKDFIGYFYKLNDEEKDEIIYYTLLYKKYLNDIKNGNLDKIYNMYQILLNKLKYDKLNEKEIYIYEHVISYMIICGEFKSNELFSKYINTYLKNVNRRNMRNRLFIILQDIINGLNDEYNKNYSFIFLELENVIASTNWFDEKYLDKILLDTGSYYKYYSNKTIEDLDVVHTLAVQSFIILHEYKHLLQSEYIRNHDDDLSNIYKYEMYNIWNNKKMYNKNHHGYYIEKEANDFALNNFFRFIKKYLQNTYLDEEKLKEYNYNYWNLGSVDKKSFLIKYKIMLECFTFLKKNKISTKKLIIFNEVLNEKK